MVSAWKNLSTLAKVVLIIAGLLVVLAVLGRIELSSGGEASQPTRAAASTR